jgi:DNA-binding response OmpR family regulator
VRILIAEDDETSRIILESLLEQWGHEVVTTVDGDEAWKVLSQADTPRLAILDWMMPGLSGPELCGRLRERKEDAAVYTILLTAMGESENIVSGLQAGADDYMTKPFENDELQARIAVAERILNLQQALQARVDELKHALEHVKTLQGILPICMHCHKIRQDEQSWQKLEDYLQAHSTAEFSHSLCDECLEKYYPKDDSGDDDLLGELEKLK